jgi:cell surface protein SprA
LSSKSGFKYISISSAFAFFITLVWGATPAVLPEKDSKSHDFKIVLPPDSSAQDTSRKPLKFPIKDRIPYERASKRHPLDLSEPSNISEKYALDSSENRYNYSSQIGNSEYRMPASVTIAEQLKAENNRQNIAYFRQRAQANNMASGSGIIPPLKIGPKIFERIFGSGVIDIRPRGTAELIFSGNFNTVKNPAFAPQQQTIGQFDFRQKIQLSVQGSIGDRLKVNLNYDTEATFDFENQVKLDYAGKDDDIIKKIELGNVSLPLNSSLIQGSQSLFGVKSVMQFGRLTMTSIFTQQRGRTTETEIQGGAQSTRFDIQGDNYDMNRHFFLSHYFRDNYDQWLSNLPIIGSPVIINRVEVWVTNRTGAFDNSRDVVGFADMGEASRRDNKNWNVNPIPFDTFPNNLTNGLYDYLLGRSLNSNKDALRSSFDVQNQLLRDQNQTKLQAISQYQMINYSRLLSANEYTINPRLGYISLNQTLNNDDVLCVAYEYTLNGKVYKVGEFTTDVPVNAQQPNVLFTKMLKGPSLRPDLPIWDLMMKNIYSLGTFGVQQKDFRLNIIYADDPSGADLNYIPAQNEPALIGVPLVSVFNLDNLNTQQERAPDGLFDFIEGVTINTQQGRIIFPMVEPFGTYLQKKFINDPSRARYYCFYELYDSTRFAAIQLPQYNKFFLRGSYQGQSTNEISLNSTNVPRGSVRVTANGAPLTENVDFTVDYNIGRVRIINTGLLNSGAIIKVSSESNSLFSIQQKTLMGSRFDFKVNRDFLLGGTVLWLNERPLTPKVNLNEEPISNVMIGFDGSYKTESRLITKIVDALPFIETKEKSDLTLSAEYARLFPGVQGALAQGGTAYLDDFEGSETQIDLRGTNNWVLASTPQGQTDLFPEGNLLNDLTYGFRRAQLSWYSIPTNFYQEGNPFRPTNITDEELSNHRVRQIFVNEIYPSRQIQQGMPQNIATLDFAFYPKERGPFNYTLSGLNADGTLKDPKNNWGGLMRKIDQNDFEAANIDYIEIWMLDPYLSNPNQNNRGQLYINLGNISEDVLRDNRKAAENGLPRANDLSLAIDTTVWGRVTRQPVINYAFDADPASRELQDVGLDGLNDEGERLHFSNNYLQQVANLYGTTSIAYQLANEDPSKDNFQFYLNINSPSILDRFRYFSNTQGNSPVSAASPPPVATNLPDMEDINRDYTLNDIEEYYQYRIDISKERLVVGQNYVTDSVVTTVKLENGTNEQVTWYQLKVPIREYEKRVGQILDFKSIRFMRVFMRGFEDQMVLRLGAFQLVRADWRKYLGSLEQGKENKPSDPDDDTKFVVSTVNIEENRFRVPLPYVTPPGIQRELDFSAPQAIQQNEQSLSVQICNLKDADARGVFKNVTNVDLRRYGKLRMFVHAEGTTLNDGELTAFVRLGTDLTNNYYEYEIPLKASMLGDAGANNIWPSENEMILELEELINTKIQRTNASHPFTAVYTRDLGGNKKIRVVGLPDLSNVRVMMLGVRNPRAFPGSNDDGLPKCAEVWFNEMRATEFNNNGGWAATARAQVKLADFGTMQVAGNLTTVGFGGIDKKINERTFDDTYQYDIQGSFELGKFLPTKLGISIPIFLSYGNTLVRPFYNPLNPDTRLQKEIDETTNEERRDRISRAADDFTARRSLNFTNIRKNRVGAAKAHVWDIENWTFTYSYSETFRRNQTMEYYILQNYKTITAYQYSFNPKAWEPFNKIIKSKQLTLLKDFNLMFLPQVWGARLETDRRYGVTINRNNDNPLTLIQPLYDKMFTMTRYYEFSYSLSKSLRLDYNATVLARVDEPLGQIDEKTPAKRDSMWNNFWNGGRLMQYDQAIRFNYNIPINKIQQLNFISQSAYSYTVNYQWKQAPPAADSLGNTISNSKTEAWNFNLNMSLLYNKWKFLRDINNPVKKTPRKPADEEEEKKEPNKKDTKTKKKKEDNSPKNYGPFVRIPFKLITSLKNITFAHTTNKGVALPGFKTRPQYLGQNFDNDGPGFDFILAMQDDNYRFRAAENGWLSNDPRITNFYTEDFRENITGRATLEPITDFRIELNMQSQRSLQTSVLFRYDSIRKEFVDVNIPTQTGNFSITYNTLATAFNDPAEVFKRFQENRLAIANRLGQNPELPGGTADSNGFPRGYSRLSQEVLIPAFLSAYGGEDASKIGLTPFPKIPDLNWRITYNGLTKIELIKEYASNVTISNQYTSTYNVGAFQTILPGDTNASPSFTGDYASKYQIRQISITERWGPFIGIDITFVNNIQAKLEYKRDRTMNFTLTNGQLNEQTASEWVIGAGYRASNLAIPMLGGGGRRLVLENEVNFRLDFSIRNNLTKIRYLDRESNDPVQGQVIYDLKPQIDYNFNEKLMMRIFYSYRRTDPATSNSFPTIIQSGGVSLRYTIQ